MLGRQGQLLNSIAGSTRDANLYVSDTQRLQYFAVTCQTM